MSACPQTPTQSVLEHGESVSRVYDEIYNWMCEPTEYVRTSINCDYDRDVNPPYPLPKWVHDYREDILDALDGYNQEQIEEYHVYHDCGKPFCRVVDSKGQQHFPDHAHISEATYLQVFDPADELVASWIRADMEIHLLKAVDIPEFCSRPGAVVLLITGLAEVYANAQMFGGYDSTSFKIKYKQLDRRGRAICKYLWGTNG